MLPGKYLWRNRISNRKSETYWSSEGWLTDSGISKMNLSQAARAIAQIETRLKAGKLP